MDILSYAMGKKAGGGGSTINNQDKTLTENGQYTADSGYTGLGTVTVNVPEPTGTISITQNGDNIDVKDYAKANVNVPEPTGNINITDTNQTNVKDYATAQVVDADLVAGNIKKDVNILGVVGTYEGSGGRDWSQIGYSAEPQVIQDGFDYAKDIYDNWNSSQTSLAQKFEENLNLIFMPAVNTSNSTNFYRTFKGCRCLIKIPLLDTTNATNVEGMFMECYALKNIELSLNKATSLNGIFSSCSSLKNVILNNTLLVTNMNSLFNNTYAIENVSELDATSVTNISNFTNLYSSYPNFTTFGGLKDLGKAYDTSQSANYSNYSVQLMNCKQLTHDSLMNVINKLYDIATAGVQAQSLMLGATNLAKLTAEEISTCTSKGWSIS